MQAALTTDFPNNSSMNKTNQEKLKNKLREYSHAYTFLNSLRLLNLPPKDDFDEKKGADTVWQHLNQYKGSENYKTLKSIEEEDKRLFYKITKNGEEEQVKIFGNLFQTIKDIKDEKNIPYKELQSNIIGCLQEQKKLQFLDPKKNNYTNCYLTIIEQNIK